MIQIIEAKEIIRKCVICAKDIAIKLYPDRKYKGGYFFGKMKIKKDKFEYWECNKCYKR